jgi:hypothetical protein
LAARCDPIQNRPVHPLFPKRKKKMTDLVERTAELRRRLIRQAADKIGMDDYQQQLRAYQEMILEIIDILAEVVKVREVDIDITVSGEK